MKVISKYISNDNIEFSNEVDCREHELNYIIASNIVNKLEPIPENDGCSFGNGHGYIQQDNNNVIKYRNEFLEFIKRYTTFKWVQETIDNPNSHLSWVTRAIGDSNCPHTIYRMWSRFTCIDNEGREWGQPFYATNPNQAEQIKLN